jgi:lipopolysaccharide/colanic/teichoic acid biosynthesis glycosyltransferase
VVPVARALAWKGERSRGRLFSHRSARWEESVMHMNATQLAPVEEPLGRATLWLKDHPVRLRRSWYLPAKTALDWMLVLLMLPAATFVITFFALLVKIESSGPAFYRQRRVGRGGRVFWIYKIRSMKHNCETGTGAVWSSGKADPRVTRIGRFLRDTHLDELPQLLNVLKLQMSLIGPRPERPELIASLEQDIPHYRDRLLVKPGLTGLAQMQLPPDSDVQSVKKKLAYDRYYVQQLSFLADVRIMLCTALYMGGALSHSLGQLLVKQYGKEVERDYLLDLIDEQQQPA